MKNYNHFILLLIITYSWVNVSAQIIEPPNIKLIQKSTTEIDVNSPIVIGEYFFNADPGIGNGTKISFNQSENIDINTTLAVSGINPGFNNLFVRVKDNRGIWSLCEGRIVYVQPIKTILSQTPLVSGEYFFDTDPGIGKGKALSSFNLSDNISLNNQISVAGLTEGFHNLFIRIKDSSGKWSLYEGRIVYVQPAQTTRINNQITKGEYFFDNDPGIGKGTNISGINISDNISLLSQISAGSLSPGFHNLFVRVKDNSNNWSLYEGRIVYVQPDKPSNTIVPITKGEYFFNTDPGVGKGFPLTAFTKANNISIIQEFSISDIPTGTNHLFVRTMDSFGVWSMYIANPVPLVINSVNDIPDDGISIYPNPVKSEFRIDGIENLKSLDIIDLTGKVYLSKNLVSKESVNVENLQKGIYFVRINIGNEIIKKKMIKN